MAGRAVGTAEDPAQVGLEGVQQREAVPGPGGRHAEEAGVLAAGGQVAVADVVHEPGVAVHGHEVLAPDSGRKNGATGKFSCAALARVLRSGSPVCGAVAAVTVVRPWPGRRGLRRAGEFP